GSADIHLSQAAFARLDINRDGFLDAAELERFADRPADVEVAVHLGQRGQGEPALAVTVVEAEGKSPPPLGPSAGDGAWLLTSARGPMEMRCYRGRPRHPASARQSMLHRFQDADVGRRGFLDLNQARRADFFPSSFSLLDRDGDGRLTEKELLAYLDGVQPFQAKAVSSVAGLQIDVSGQGLFEALDADGDGRLSRRELRGAVRLLDAWDSDGDGFL